MKKQIKTKQKEIVLCQKCGKKETEHCHYKLWETKPLRTDHRAMEKKHPELFEWVCTVCHAKIHGIEPKLSILREKLILYQRTQKARCAISNQVQGLSRIEMKIPDNFTILLKNLEKQEKEYEKEIKNLLEGKGEKTKNWMKTHTLLVTPYPIYDWLKTIKGISHILSAKLIAYIDIKNSPTVSCLWYYSGQAPQCKRTKGKKANWHHDLKMACFQIADSFMKQRTPVYRDIYDVEKEKQSKLMEKVKKKSKGYSKIKDSAPKSKGHAHARALRKSVKAFLKDYWVEAKRLESKSKKHHINAAGRKPFFE